MKNKWIKLLITVISTLVIAIILITIMTSQTTNGILIVNMTKADVVVTRVVIDNTLISTRKIKLQPWKIDKNTDVYARIKFSQFATMDIFIEKNGLERGLRCNFEIPRTEKWFLVTAYIKDDNNLECARNSYNDFDD